MTEQRKQNIAGPNLGGWQMAIVELWDNPPETGVIHTLSISWGEGQQWNFYLPCPLWLSPWTSSAGCLYAMDTRQAAAELGKQGSSPRPVEFTLIWAQVLTCVVREFNPGSKERRDKKAHLGIWLPG